MRVIRVIRLIGLIRVIRLVRVGADLIWTGWAAARVEWPNVIFFKFF